MILAIVTASAWLWREDMHLLYHNYQALLPATFIATLVACNVMLIGLWTEHIVQRRIWLRRVEDRIGVEGITPPTILQKWSQHLPDPIEWLLGPLLRTRFGKRLAKDWIDADLGKKASRYIMILVLTSIAGVLFGYRIGGLVLGIALGVVFPLLPKQIVRGRAELNRRKFSEQLPQVLDSLASGLSAGLSFHQAVDYAADELPDPTADAMKRLSRRINLGYPVDRSLQMLLEDYPEESFALVVDGITIQRQFGGDLVAMLEETAGLLRERLELEREVRAITTQGRLSGWVVAALVPVSAGILLFTNPIYINILFETVIGQAMLVIALILQLAGGVIISRMVRIRY